jgi:hypothetical protein
MPRKPSAAVPGFLDLILIGPLMILAWPFSIAVFIGICGLNVTPVLGAILALAAGQHATGLSFSCAALAIFGLELWLVRWRRRRYPVRSYNTEPRESPTGVHPWVLRAATGVACVCAVGVLIASLVWVVAIPVRIGQEIFSGDLRAGLAMLAISGGVFIGAYWIMTRLQRRFPTRGSGDGYICR